MEGNTAVAVLQGARDWVDYLTLGSTLGGVIVVGVYTYLTYRQLRLTKSVLIETQRSNAATERSNKIAQGSLELAQKSFDSANESSALSLEQTRRSNKATEESNKIAERTLELGKRSWLVVKSWSGSSVPEPGSVTGPDGSDIPFEVTVVNVGGVPAIIRRFGWDFVQGELPEKFELLQGSASGKVVFGGDCPLYLQKHFSAEEWARIAANRAPLYLYWIVEYSDCMDKTWRTTKAWKRHDDRSWREATEPQCSLLE